MRHRQPQRLPFGRLQASAIMSTYLGTSMTDYLQDYAKSSSNKYTSASRFVELGPEGMAPLKVPAEDRNRTSPFPYGGHRFEFRAVGSSQNVSLVNTVLGSIVAKSFKEFADQIEGGASAKSVAQAALNSHFKCVFNGNGYSPKEQDILTKNGVWRIDSGIDDLTLAEKKNMGLFEELKVLNRSEAWLARRYVPALLRSRGDQDAVHGGHDQPACHPCRQERQRRERECHEECCQDDQGRCCRHPRQGRRKAKAELARTLRLETMVDIRKLATRLRP